MEIKQLEEDLEFIYHSVGGGYLNDETLAALKQK